MKYKVIPQHMIGTRKARPKLGDKQPKDYVDIWRGMRRCIIRAGIRAQKLLVRNPDYFRAG